MADKKESKKPRIKQHLESLVGKTKLDKKEITSQYDSLYKGILGFVGTKYGKHSISEDMKKHYAEFMGQLTIGGDILDDVYTRAGKEVSGDFLKKDVTRANVAKYIKEIAKYTGHHYAEAKDDTVLTAKIESIIDSQHGEGSFKKMYEALKEDKAEDQLLELIRGYMQVEHKQNYEEVVYHDFLFELDADQMTQFTAAHGSHLKNQHRIKSVGVENLASSKARLKSHVDKHISRFERAVNETYSSIDRHLPEGGGKNPLYKK